MLRRLSVGLVALLPVSVFAAAVPVDTADALAQIGVINVAVAAIGGGLLVAAALAVAFKWAKAAIFS